jgi:hypothetical protein
MNIPASHRFPAITLTDALKFGELLFKNAGRTAVDPEVAVTAIGYSSLNGAARNTMSALVSYGVLAKVGGQYRVSEEALKALRPVVEQDRLNALRSMALRPPLFGVIHKEHRECSEQVLAGILLHQGLAEDSAKRAAKIYKINASLARLDEDGPKLLSLHLTDKITMTDAPSIESSPTEGTIETVTSQRPQLGLKSPVLAQYSVPLGSNEATIVFTGESLVPEDFEALSEFVLLFKKQFERKLKSEKGDDSSRAEGVLSQIELKPQPGKELADFPARSE